jgi:hypothetical protein
MTALRVVVDAAPLPDEEARAFWKRFSDWMEEHRGDLAGFAQAEGLASVHPEMHGGTPVLVASHTAKQRPYATAPDRPAERHSPGVAQSRTGALQRRPRRPVRGGP